LGTCVLSVFHWHSSYDRNVLYVTHIITWRTMIVKGQSMNKTPLCILTCRTNAERAVVFDKTRRLLVTKHWCNRNRRASNHRPHLSLVPIEKLCPGRNDILVYRRPTPDQDNILPHSQRHAGSNPHWKISVADWPSVLHRIDQGEPLRKVASDYDVSHETVRRIMLHAQKQRVQQEA